MEIHDYSPPDPGEGSISTDGPHSITDTTQPKPTDEGHTKFKTEPMEDQEYVEKSSNNNIFKTEKK